jgi:uncharacterized protein (TIGR00255 family)
MSISSMTGFARADGAADGLTWAWEVRSVNGRGLDVRLRLPPGLEAIEGAVRDAAAKRFSRGNISINLALDKQSANGSLRLNEQVLADVIRAADRAVELTGGARPDTAALLSFKGVLEPSDAARDEPEQRAARERALLAGCELALDKLTEARRAEGARLKSVIEDQVADIAALAATVRASPSRTKDAIRARLSDLIGRLTSTSEAFDADRLHQEALLIATRIDVEEELVRLDSHVVAAREILAESGAVGRKLDFLAQEFNREANTLCSKANAVDVTRSGMTLKTVIDQLREQVQNVE